ncbi:MAG: STAS domain-containing protein [Verrucomicrobiales bacterium]|nr:STAS domain-containing protein [Verrucomicrobiales bacterium]
MNTDTSIFVGSLDDIAWVRIEGVATKDTASGIQGYFSETFSRGLRNFTIDLKDCRLIDSTFIGILTGLAGSIASEGNSGEVKVIHPNERNEKSICKLGLDNLITIDRDGSSACEMESLISQSLHPLYGGEMSKVEKASLILDAHEKICEANEENRSVFKDVLKFLKQDLLKWSKDGDKSAGNPGPDKGFND